MAKKHKSVRAAQEAGSLYFYDKNGTKKLAVTAEQLNAWKKKNKGKYKGNALTAWANNKGKDVGAPKKKEEIQVRKLSPSTVGKGRGDGEMELFQRKVDKRKAKSSTAQDNNPNKKLSGAGTIAKDSGGATRDDGLNLAPKRTGSKDKTSAARNSAARVKAKDNIERGNVATNSPATATNQNPDQNKTGRLSPRLLELQRKRLERQAAKRAEMNKGGMAKKKVMTYNLGGMVKSQTNNLKKGIS